MMVADNRIPVNEAISTREKNSSTVYRRLHQHYTKEKLPSSVLILKVR
jgi:hypothetical protein